MAARSHDSDDDELEAFVRARLVRMGEHWAAREVVEDALTLHRDLWLALYELDRVPRADGGA